ncbi:ATP-binding protein [Marinigracilibium pacificum]|uniref:histidine kinase n=1 Tax=Marinigracilibium pacificum TaxID=2729599 RepID=A0A848J1C6_9BACT|nr:ATP-binding protein [Marinigracilibium pacificum]NMM49616.1 tetratricopeptide repeat protein [Marinigracilibium pacificum]
MKTLLKYLTVFLLCIFSNDVFSQTNDLEINEDNYLMYKDLVSDYLHSDPDSAYNLGKVLITYLKKIEDKDEEIIVKSYMAVAAIETGNYKTAVLLVHQSLGMLDGITNNHVKRAAYSNSGLVYKSLGYYSKAIEYYQNSLDHIEDNNERMKALPYGHIGDCYVELGEVEKGLDYILKANDFNIKSGNEIGELFTASYLMNAYLKLGRNDDVLNLYSHYRKKMNSSNEILAKVMIKLSAAKAYRNVGELDSMFVLLHSSAGESEKMKLNSYTEEIYKLLAEFYEVKGLSDKADEYYKLYVNLLTENSRINREREIQALQMGFELANQAEENQRLFELARVKDAAARRQTFYTWVFIGLSLILAIILYRSYKIRQELRAANNKLVKSRQLIINQNTKIESQNKQLEEKVEARTRALSGANNELRTQNDQLEQYAFITAHNLRSPIARMIGLIQILDNQSEEEKETILKHIRTEANSLDQIVKDLNQILSIRKGAGKAYHEINVKESLKEIIDPFVKQFEEIDGEIHLSCPEKIYWHLIPAYFKSIFQNLISNAIKYKDSNRKLIVNINVNIEGGELVISVDDTAIGMDLDLISTKIFGLYQRFTSNVEGKGMGLYMVKLQAESMNGRVEVDSQKGKGTKFIIRFQSNG